MFWREGPFDDLVLWDTEDRNAPMAKIEGCEQCSGERTFPSALRYEPPTGTLGHLPALPDFLTQHRRVARHVSCPSEVVPRAHSTANGTSW